MRQTELFKQKQGREAGGWNEYGKGLRSADMRQCMQGEAHTKAQQERAIRTATDFKTMHD
jgi:hypothetical protein